MKYQDLHTTLTIQTFRADLLTEGIVSESSEPSCIAQTWPGLISCTVAAQTADHVDMW